MPLTLSECPSMPAFIHSSIHSFGSFMQRNIRTFVHSYTPAHTYVRMDVHTYVHPYACMYVRSYFGAHKKQFRHKCCFLKILKTVCFWFFLISTICLFTFLTFWRLPAPMSRETFPTLSCQITCWSTPVSEIANVRNYYECTNVRMYKCPQIPDKKAKNLFSDQTNLKNNFII